MRQNTSTALVTGATSGIGLAAARRLAAGGAYVFLTGRRQAALDAAVAATGGNATGIRADIARLDELDQVFAAVREQGRGLDVLLANAGGTLFTVQKALPLLNPGASVILTGSNIDVKGAASFSVYAATKAALRSFTRSWAAELVGNGIRVNSIAPGPIETPGLAGLAAGPEAAEQLFAGLAAGVPMKRLGKPEEIAGAVVFLASRNSSFMTGAELYVDGGTSQV